MREVFEPERTNSLWWNRPVVYWQTNQVVLTFHSPLEPSAGVERVIASLKLNELRQFLQDAGFTLQSFSVKDVPHPEEHDRKEAFDRFEAEDDEAEEDDEESQNEHGQLNSPIGKYLFHPPSGYGTSVLCFFHSQFSSPSLSSFNAMSSSMGGNPDSKGMTDSTQALVTKINRNLDKLRRDGEIPIVAAMPNWIGGGTKTELDMAARSLHLFR
jgi:hypothetical protein